MKVQNLKSSILTIDLEFKKFGPISKIFFPALRIDSATSISGFFNDSSSTNRIEVWSPQIAYNRLKLNGLDLSIQSDKQGISADLNSKYFQLART